MSDLHDTPRPDHEPEFEPEMDDVRGLLDRAARRQEDVLEEARQAMTQADVDFVQTALDREAGEGRTGRGWAWYVLALATAAGLWLWIAPRFGKNDLESGPSDAILGDEELRILTPVGPVRGYGTIEWDFPISAGIVFDVKVVDSADAQRILLHEAVEQTSVRVDPRESAAWPGRIEISVRALGADGELLTSSSASASLAP